MIRVVVGGATGRLGALICNSVRQQKDMQLVGGIVSQAGGHVGREIAPGILATGADDMAKLMEDADVYIDATSASAVEHNLLQVPSLGVNCVIGTTGLSEDFLKRFEGKVTENDVSAVVSPNFSVGVNVFWKMCGVLAAVLEDYDVEIIETHHDKKKDAPSGTALKAAQIVSEVTGIEKLVYGRSGMTEARGREIGIHSIRAGMWSASIQSSSQATRSASSSPIVPIPERLSRRVRSPPSAGFRLGGTARSTRWPRCWDFDQSDEVRWDQRRKRNGVTQSRLHCEERTLPESIGRLSDVRGYQRPVSTNEGPRGLERYVLR